MSFENGFVIENGILLKYDGTDTVVEIPENVSEIEEYAFENNQFIKSVKISGSIKKIGESAFENCSALKSVYFSEGLEEIQKYAFKNCVSLYEIEIPKSVEEIGRGCFWSCSSLKSINIPEKCCCIQSETFFDCKSLKNVILSDKLQWIEYSAFQGNSSLESIVIPQSVFNIEYSVFEDCVSLSEVVLPQKIDYIDNKLFKNCAMLYEIELPKGINNIGYEAFENCVSLRKIIIPENVRTIYEGAFSGCVSLEEISIPARIKKIGEEAFRGCKKIKTFSMPDVMKEQSFSWWQEIFGDDNVYIVAIQFFDEKSKLVKALKRNWREAFPKILSFKRIELLLKYISFWKKVPLDLCEEFILMASESGFSEGVSALVEYKKKNYPIKKIEKIQQDKLEKALGLKKLTVNDWKKIFVFRNENGKIIIKLYKGNDTDVIIPSEIGKTPVIAIGDGAFQNCDKIKSVTITEGVVEIGRCAFYGCTALEFLSIPESIEKIGDDAFYRSSSLEYTEYENGLYLGSENNPYLILVRGKNEDIKECIINEKTKWIYPFAFNGCNALLDLEIPESVVEIGACAFMGCRNLFSIKLPNNLKKVGYCAFFKSDKLTISGEAGSFAENTAKKHKIPFNPI